MLSTTTSPAVPAAEKNTEKDLKQLIELINRLHDASHREKMTFVEPKTFQHHNYTELTSFLQDYNKRCPDITRLYTVGKSVQGRELWVIEISDNPGIHEPGKKRGPKIRSYLKC